MIVSLHFPLLRAASVAKSLPDPLAPLPQQKYFHGALSRVEAEALLMGDGEYLIRESTKKQGQYVLTGMAGGKAQHLLLMDKEGRVSFIFSLLVPGNILLVCTLDIVFSF